MNSAGRTLAGRYELLEVIGRGGMGTVYRATDSVLRRTVAVKVLANPLAEDPMHAARFEREARAAAALAHPAVVAVYDTGADQSSRFIVMEYVAGRNLAVMLRKEAPLGPDRAASIAGQVADALAVAHAAGIVHRDVKPGNVMIAEDGSVKVLDFGVARITDGATLTQTASIPGTAAYMAPEQALGAQADARSDVYSLGCLLYAMLTGRPPFTGEALAAVLNQHVNSDPRPPRETNRRVPPALDTLVMGMLAKAPDARPQSATQVRARLGQVPGAAPVLSATAPTAQQRLDETAVTRVLRGRDRVRRRGLLAAAAALAGVVLLIAVIALTPGGGASRDKSLARHHQAASRPIANAHHFTTVTAPATSTPGPPPRILPPAATQPSSPATEPPAPSELPPGHGGEPPGQAKKHGDSGHGEAGRHRFRPARSDH
ncbi:MAG: protein kinase domain-containing protein [Solirubrobacteraceae bacterium]